MRSLLVKIDISFYFYIDSISVIYVYFTFYVLKCEFFEFLFPDDPLLEVFAHKVQKRKHFSCHIC